MNTTRQDLLAEQVAAARGEESAATSDAGLAADVARAEREILAQPAGGLSLIHI